ncbi:MAG TPA: hypothetical protein VLI54_02535 [Bacillota bacterium]|nr:hypothetical protein [Bacillota bacterium]
MNKHLAGLMQKEMTRKEFLTTLGLGIATVLGFGSLIKLVTGKSLGGTSGGYGSSTYGSS